MNDAYVEQLVKKNATMGQMAIRVGSIVSGILITYILMVLIGLISLVAAFAIGYGIYYLFMMTDVEYEYTLVKNELTVDIVYGRNKRKRAGVYDVQKCEVVAPVDSTYAAMYHRNAQMKTMDFTSGTSEDVYIMVVGYGAGNAKMYFEPSKEMIQAMKTQAPSKVKEC